MAGQCAGCTADPWDIFECRACIDAKTAPSNVCEVLKNMVMRFVKTSDPGVDDDTDEGYHIGDIWVNTNNSKSFICIDNASGAADWDQIN
ncbi:MAG: hypothetical protein ACYTBJ_11370 [Planctomycetota bacterium]|jgi:hypothetical protein